MEKNIDSPNPSLEVQKQELSNEVELLLTQLPKAINWNGAEICLYQGFWYHSNFLPGMIKFQRHFEAQNSDIILVTFPKSGTTWLKALTFSVVNRSRYTPKNNPLLTTSTHVLVPFLDHDIYMRDGLPVLEDFPTPRILSTHTPFASLPKSIKNSNCRIVYMWRNPLDQFISHWQFSAQSQKQTVEPVSLDEAFEMVCQGIQVLGPIWDHVLGYWKASKEEPQKMLFLKYEDLKEDINFYVKRLADFLGCPFTEDEKNRRVIEEISELCSFNNMKNLEVNKTGKLHLGGIEFNNSSFIRKGSVGDWTNYLSVSMAEHLEKIIEEKLSGSGLTFKKP